jgi:hypothetical protein
MVFQQAGPAPKPTRYIVQSQLGNWYPTENLTRIPRDNTIPPKWKKLLIAVCETRPPTSTQKKKENFGLII